MTLTEFLLARIAEDEAVAREVMPLGPVYEIYGDTAVSSAAGLAVGEGADREIAALIEHVAEPSRVLAECEAKRRILEDYQALDADYRVTRNPVTEARRFQTLVAVGQLAAVFADHPDYREEWRP